MDKNTVHYVKKYTVLWNSITEENIQDQCFVK